MNVITVNQLGYAKTVSKKRIKEMNYITVLDFEAGRVFQYDMPERVMENNEYEEYLSELGHNLNGCEWMVHKNPQVITN